MSRAKPNTAPTGSPARAGHLRQGVEHLVDQRVGIDHLDRLPGQTLGGRLVRGTERIQLRCSPFS